MKVQFSTLCVRISVVALLIAGSAGVASAQAAHATTLTFDRAVRVPGVTLTPGTYVFERVASDKDQRTVQIFRVYPRRVVATLMAIPTTRDGGGADVIFTDAPRGSLPVVRVWYERGTQDGYAFIYRRAELERIAEPGVELSTR